MRSDSSRAKIKIDPPLPCSIPLRDFVTGLNRNGEVATEEKVTQWILSSFREESLIRYGARKSYDYRLRNIKNGQKARLRGYSEAVQNFCDLGEPLCWEYRSRLLMVGVNGYLNLLRSGAEGVRFDKQNRVFVPGSGKARAGVIRLEVLGALSESSAGRGELSKKIGRSKASIARTLLELRRDGFIELVGRGKVSRWKLVTSDCGGTDGR